MIDTTNYHDNFILNYDDLTINVDKPIGLSIKLSYIPNVCVYIIIYNDKYYILDTNKNININIKNSKNEDRNIKIIPIYFSEYDNIAINNTSIKSYNSIIHVDKSSSSTISLNFDNISILSLMISW